MATDEIWKCAGCGVASPGRVRSCDCPTNVVSQADSKIARTAWKRPKEADELSTRCHAIIGKLYLLPAAKVRLETKDADLIKIALKQYADQLA